MRSFVTQVGPTSCDPVGGGHYGDSLETSTQAKPSFDKEKDFRKGSQYEAELSLLNKQKDIPKRKAQGQVRVRIRIAFTKMGLGGSGDCGIYFLFLTF